MIGLAATLGVLAAAIAICLAWTLRATPWQAVLVAGITLLMSGGLYGLLGAPRLLPVLEAWHMRQERLEARMQAAEQREDWAALGQAAMEAGAFTQSAEAYRRAVIASDGAPALILGYAKALIFSAEGTVTDEAARGLNAVMLQEADNAEAQYFLALQALQQGQTAEAMHRLRTLYRRLPPDAPLKRIIDRQIGRE